jgi:hypothetical protein
MTVTYFYNYNASKNRGYNKFAHGTVVVSNKTEDFDPYKHVKDMANKAYPDADNINITALNII